MKPQNISTRERDFYRSSLRYVIPSANAGPDDVLRVYGHRIREGSPGDCEDSELMFPLAPIEKAPPDASAKGIRDQ